MTVSLETLRRYVRNCDPARPLTADDPFYVPLDDGEPVRGAAGRSPVEELHRMLQLADPLGESCQLFTSFAGSGKTTEFHRLARLLETDPELPTRVVFVDFETWLDRYTPVSINDVLRVLAWCLDREAILAEGGDPDRGPSYLTRLAEMLRKEVKLTQFGMIEGPTLLFELRDNPSFRQKVEAVLSQRFQAFAQDAQKEMAAAVTRLRRATAAERIVVLCDGLEKITPLHEEERADVEASAETLFLQHARFLQPPCHVVYTYPYWLSFQTVGLGAIYQREPVLLPMVKIAEPDGRDYAPGLRKLTEVVARRVDLDAVFGSPDRLLPLVRASGGYPRGLIQLVRETLIQARSFPVPAEDLAAVVERFAEDYANVIRSTDVELLLEVAHTKALPHGDSAEVAHFGRLLTRWLVLAYRDSRRWYDVHPLARRAPALRERLDPR